MENKFKEGDVVKLKQGGLPMTVEQSGGGSVGCSFFSMEGKLYREEFQEVKLVKSFADFPVGKYTLKRDRYIGDISNDYGVIKTYHIHKDIVQGMKDHFEPIEDHPKRKGWIDEAYRDYTTSKEHGKLNNIIFKEAIEKHMPKQSKITAKELDNIKLGSNQGDYSMRKELLPLLKSKGLLE